MTIERHSTNKTEFRWQDHSSWARESVHRLLKSRSANIYKKILTELPKNPISISDSSITMCAAFAISTLEALASGLGTALKPQEKNSIVERSLNILTEIETRPDFKLSKNLYQSLFQYLEKIEKQESSFAPLWTWFLIEDKNLVDLKSHLYLKNSPLPNGFDCQHLIDLIYSNEPFLAWKEIKNSRRKANIQHLEEILYLELVTLGLFADSEMIKSEIRKSHFSQNGIASHGFCFLYLMLMIRGDFNWIEDRTLFRPMESLVSNAKEDVKQILGPLVRLCHRKSKSTLSKHLQIRNIITQISRLQQSEQQLACIAALHSIARRERWSSISQRLHQFFQALSLNISSGLTDNLWRFASVSDNKSSQRFLPGVASSVPFSKIARTVETTSITFRLTSLLGYRRLAKIVAGQSHTISLSEKEIEKILTILIPYFSKMKGPLMKLGQTLSYTHFGLPPHLLDRLKSLQSESTPLDFEIIFKEIQKNEKLNSQIVSMESFPIGVGSLGQVHRAKLKDGRQVVVKVKFPNIEKIIQEDLEILRSVIGLAEMIVPRLRLKPYIAELHHQLSLECDYAREAQSQMLHRAKMSPILKSLYIPEVYPDLCSDRILVSEYMGGMKLEEACRSGTQAQKDLWGKTLVEYTVAACRDGHFNSDPHPGNLLFQEDKLIYFDFGSVCEWKSNVTDSWNYLIMSCLIGKPELVLKAFAGFQNTGITNRNAQSLASALQNPVPGSWTTPGRQTLSSASLKKQMMALANVTSSTKNGINMPKELLFGTRVYFGHLSIVISLESQADWLELANQVMKPWSDQNLPT